MSGDRSAEDGRVFDCWNFTGVCLTQLASRKSKGGAESIRRSHEQGQAVIGPSTSSETQQELGVIRLPS